MSTAKSNDIEGLLVWLREYASKRINSRMIDERRCFPPYLILDLGNRGLLGMSAPKLYGGMELNNTDLMQVLQQLGAIDSAIGLFVGLNNILGIRPILKYGSQSLKEEILPKLATGRELAAFSITESSAGSNPLAINAKAVYYSPGVWQLFGKKSWSGSATWAGVINIFVRLCDKNNSEKGITGFVVKQGTKGIRQGEEALTMGMRGMVQNSIYLEGAMIEESYRLGQEGSGMEVAQDAMMYGRLAIGAISLGGMKRCLQLILRYSKRRTISTGILIENAITLMHISEMSYSITALENLIENVVYHLDKNEFVPKEFQTVCKIFGSEFFWEAADRLMQILGGRGYIETNIAPQILRDARIFRIFEGPTETLCSFLGSRWLNNPQELYGFINNILKEPSSVEFLKSLVNRIQEEIKGGNKSDFLDPKVYQLKTFVAGKILIYAVPLIVLRHKYKESCNRALVHTIHWLESSINQILLKNIEQNAKEDNLLNISDIDGLLSSYEHEIGDIEQSMTGEELSIDSMLLKSHVLEPCD